MQPSACGLITLITSYTSAAPMLGTSPTPVTGNVALAPAAIGAAVTPPVPDLVSSTLTGVTGKYWPAAGISAAAGSATAAPGTVMPAAPADTASTLARTAKRDARDLL